jgi:hypothetical protein
MVFSEKANAGIWAMKKPRLTLVKSNTSDIEPPRPLNVEGRALWNRFAATYDFSDEAGRELLAQIAEAADNRATEGRLEGRPTMRPQASVRKGRALH